MVTAQQDSYSGSYSLFNLLYGIAIHNFFKQAKRFLDLSTNSPNRPVSDKWESPLRTYTARISWDEKYPKQ
jgi:hypothetical protein